MACAAHTLGEREARRTALLCFAVFPGVPDTSDPPVAIPALAL